MLDRMDDNSSTCFTPPLSGSREAVAFRDALIYANRALAASGVRPASSGRLAEQKKNVRDGADFACSRPLSIRRSGTAASIVRSGGLDAHLTHAA
ncbi:MULTISPECIES: hypothetical protein [unclassified Rhizobium]|uniref:hypothetical protein n=1 Tax=unclassified Rhizobium TaxID=2613769 RepID=UPI001AD990C1|nr:MULTISPECIES: hypothetical protein [unclassified Rhizobium]MBO9125540.1 hypothetical protein [Rhizobium sp. 16-488-2b]MBO9176125.1 hypothetical protein [Rhizobium sp. 16-488-2a]